MTKLVTRQQQVTNNENIQIFKFNGDDVVEMNTNASWNELLAVSNEAQDAGMDFTMKMNPVEGGMITITTWN